MAFRYKCYECKETYENKTSYIKHEANFHRRQHCVKCNIFIDSKEDHDKICKNSDECFKFTGFLEKSQKAQIGYSSENVEKFLKNSKFILKKNAFKNFLTQYELINELESKDLENFFSYYSKEIKRLFKFLISNFGAIKIQFCVQILFNRNDNNLIVEQIGYFSSKFDTISNIGLFDKFLAKKFSEIENQVQEYSVNGSNWVIEKIMRLDLHVGKHVVKYGKCYTELPDKLKNKRAIINIKNKDNFCFIYSVLAKLYPPQNQYQQYYPKHYKKYFKELNLKNIHFPMNINDIGKLEKQNTHLDIRINIYGYYNIERENEIFPIRISKLKAKNTIDLLLFNEHYFLIKNFNRFCGQAGGSNHHFCHNCLQGFNKDSKLRKHSDNCFLNKSSNVKMPSEDNIMKFTNFDHKIGKTNFVIG